MGDDDLEGLPPAMRALLDAGGEGPPAPAHVKERLLRRVETTVHLAPNVADRRETWGVAEVPAPESSTYVASAVGYASRVRARKFPLLAASFAVGLMTGGAAVYALLRPEHRTAPSEQLAQAPAESSTWSPSSGTGPPPAAASSHDVLAPAPSTHIEPRASAAPDHGNDGSLAAERALVETARAALARADGPAALAVLARHTREFPNGTFVEEREALAVQALAQTGDVAGAKARGERFRRRYPRSLFLPVVEEATHGD